MTLSLKILQQISLNKVQNSKQAFFGEGLLCLLYPPQLLSLTEQISNQMRYNVNVQSTASSTKALTKLLLLTEEK